MARRAETTLLSTGGFSIEPGQPPRDHALGAATLEVTAGVRPELVDPAAAVHQMDAISQLVDGEPLLAEVAFDADVHEVFAARGGPTEEVGLRDQHRARPSATADSTVEAIRGWRPSDHGEPPERDQVALVAIRGDGEL